MKHSNASEAVSVLRRWAGVALLASGLGWTAVHANEAAAPAAPAAQPVVVAQATGGNAGSVGGIQSANIFEIAPDASSAPGYAEQNNAQRAQVQPGNNAPMWRDVGQGVTGVTNFPYAEYGNLIQPFVQYPGSRVTNAGEAWRQVRNNWIIPYGGALMIIAIVAMALFYFGKGTIKLHGAETGRKIERFTAFERASHWVNAIAFVTLAISGIVMAFGKYFLLPVLGLNLFGWLAYILKNVHNFMGPLFAVSLIVVFLVFVRDNMPSKEDIAWILKGGGLFSGQEVPSHRFNAGEKVVFWGGVFFLGALVVASGLFLNMLVPGMAYLRGDMQIAHMIHGVASALMMAMFIGHIYMGTLGMQGAYKAMRTGYVDETWAKEHHELWYDDIKAGKIPAQRTNATAGGVSPQAAKA
jgi:formate dehydrogenase subunit gamma